MTSSSCAFWVPWPHREVQLIPACPAGEGALHFHFLGVFRWWKHFSRAAWVPSLFEVWLLAGAQAVNTTVAGDRDNLWLTGTWQSKVYNNSLFLKHPVPICPFLAWMASGSFPVTPALDRSMHPNVFQENWFLTALAFVLCACLCLEVILYPGVRVCMAGDSEFQCPTEPQYFSFTK